MKKLAIVAIVMLIVFIGVGIFAVINSFEGDKVTEAYVEPINVVKEASVLTTAENPSAKVVEGWHDESGNKYYIILLGKLEMAEIYNLDSFVYNTAIKERKIEQSTVTQDTIINTYTQHVSQTISSETVVKMENQLKVSAGLNKGIFSAGVEDTFTTSMQNTWGVSVTEEYTQSLTSIATKIKTLQKTVVIDCAKACTPGKYYRYSVCADVNCFLQIMLRPDGSGTFNSYSQIADPQNTFEVLLERDSADGFKPQSNFTLESIDLDKVDTGTLKVVYPVIERSVSLGSFDIKSSSSKDLEVIKFVDLSHFYALPGSEEYNTIHISITFAISREKDGIITELEPVKVWLCSEEYNYKESWQEWWQRDAEKEAKTYTLDTKDPEETPRINPSAYAGNKGFYLVFENQAEGYTFCIDGLTVTYTISNER